MVVGVLNVVFGVLSLASNVVRLAPGAAAGLIIAGGLAAFCGWLVWHGNRTASLVGLVLAAWLIAAQTADVVNHGDPGVAPGGLAGRFGVLALLLVALAVSTWQLRRPSPGRPSG